MCKQRLDDAQKKYGIPQNIAECMPYPTDSVIFTAENITENSTVFPYYREILPIFYHFLDDKFAFVLNSIYLRTVSIMC